MKYISLAYSTCQSRQWFAPGSLSAPSLSPPAPTAWRPRSQGRSHGPCGAPAFGHFGWYPKCKKNVRILIASCCIVEKRKFAEEKKFLPFFFPNYSAIIYIRGKQRNTKLSVVPIKIIFTSGRVRYFPGKVNLAKSYFIYFHATSGL